MKMIQCIAGLMLLSGCVNTNADRAAPSLSPAMASGQDGCQDATAVIDTNFTAGNIAGCQSLSAGRFKITLSPEDDPPINCSPWYALRLTPQAAGEVNLELDYTACGHRYWPKTSKDGTHWTYLPQQQVEIVQEDEFKSARLKIELGDKPVFVSAQEIFAPETYAAWIDQQALMPEVDRFELGKSAQNRAIDAIRFGRSGKSVKEQVILIGRQHPPEVTGAMAMLPFVEELLSDSALAKRYRARFETTVVPMLNPDGVVQGYWRHNTGSTDLNRDWGPFKQPETRLMQGMLQEIDTDPGQKLRLFVDFHSTKNDVFYTIPDHLPTDPPHYLKNWLDLFQQRMGDGYKVNIQPSEKFDQANSKNYVYKTYGVPAVTFEIGDETDRQLIGKIARESAIAMMETLLVSDPPAQ